MTPVEEFAAMFDDVEEARAVLRALERHGLVRRSVEDGEVVWTILPMKDVPPEKLTAIINGGLEDYAYAMSTRH